MEVREQIDEFSVDLRQMLTSALSLYVVAHSKKPVSTIVDDLFQIEIEASKLIMKILVQHKDLGHLKGSLARVLSFIPMNIYKRDP